MALIEESTASFGGAEALNQSSQTLLMALQNVNAAVHLVVQVAAAGEHGAAPCKCEQHHGAAGQSTQPHCHLRIGWQRLRAGQGTGRQQPQPQM